MSSVPPPPPPSTHQHQRTRKTVARRKAPLSLGEQISAARHKLAASAHLTEDRSAPVLKAQHEEKTAEESRLLMQAQPDAKTAQKAAARLADEGVFRPLSRPQVGDEVIVACAANILLDSNYLLQCPRSTG